MLSTQLATWQVLLPPQFLLWQSTCALQRASSGQGPQVRPQSTSVSTPFQVPSAHVGVLQTPSEQLKLKQSERSAQSWPSLQVAQSAPQSMSVSNSSC
jgi:hypothetical protein